MRISPIGQQPVVRHRLLRPAVAAYRVIPTLCAPRSGNPEGSVERVVGFVQNSALRVRRFRDLVDLHAPLEAWPQEVNHARRCDATGRIPAETLAEEAGLLVRRPVQAAPEAWVIEATATDTPTGTASYRGTSSSAPARHLGAPATLRVHKGRIDIDVGGTWSDGVDGELVSAARADLRLKRWRRPSLDLEGAVELTPQEVCREAGHCDCTDLPWCRWAA